MRRESIMQNKMNYINNQLMLSILLKIIAVVFQI